MSSGLFILGDDASHRVAKLTGEGNSHVLPSQTIAAIGAHSAMTWSRRIWQSTVFGTSGGTGSMIAKLERVASDRELPCRPCNSIQCLKLKHGPLPFKITWEGGNGVA